MKLIKYAYRPTLYYFLLYVCPSNMEKYLVWLYNFSLYKLGIRLDILS